jgi:hypothetical protein
MVVGFFVGDELGFCVGEEDGLMVVGFFVGDELGFCVGEEDGLMVVGFFVGDELGFRFVGVEVDCFEGALLGLNGADEGGFVSGRDRDGLGRKVGSPVGLAVTSASVGLMEGEEVGFKVVGEVDSNFTTSYLITPLNTLGDTMSLILPENLVTIPTPSKTSRDSSLFAVAPSDVPASYIKLVAV